MKITLNDRATIFAFRCVIFLAMIFMLAYSQRQEQLFTFAPFLLAAFYLLTGLFLWKTASPLFNSPYAQSAAFLWDVGVAAGVMYCSAGFDGEFYVMFFLIMFMSALTTQAWQSFLIGAVASLLYAGLWSQGKVAADLTSTNILLRFAFFHVTAFFAAAMTSRVRERDERIKRLEMRLALGRLANGGWGIELSDGLDPDVAKSVRAVGAVMENLSRALEKVMAQNEALRRSTGQALLQFAHEKERLEAQLPRPRAVRE